MGILQRLKQSGQKRIAVQKERRSFKKVVAKKTTQISRQAFAKEAEKQARLKGERLAKEQFNKPSFAQILASRLEQRPVVKSSPVIRRKSKPITRRKTRRKSTTTRAKPRRRTTRRATTRREPVQRREPARFIPQETGLSIRDLT